MKKKLISIVIVVEFIFTGLTTSTTLADDITIHSNDNEPFENSAIIEKNVTQYWALIVGVGEYAGWPNGNRPEMLKCADDMYEILTASEWWPQDHIKVIKGKNATASNIIKGLRWLDKMDDENDISLVYIATHGGSWRRDIPPLDEKDGHDEWLMTYWSAEFALRKNLGEMIWDDQLNFYLSRLDSKGICLIIDACHSGGFNDSIYFNGNRFFKDTTSKFKSYNNYLSSSESWGNNFVQNLKKDRRVIITISQEKETGSSNSGFYIVDAMNGYADNNADNIVSAEELFNYINPRIQYLECSHPTIYDSFSGELPLIKLKKDTQTSISTFDLDDKNTANLIKKSDISSENSIICGFVKNVFSGEPVEEATIDLVGDNEHNNTYSDSSGFYSMNVKPGEYNLYVSAKDYLRKPLNCSIEENMILWVNVSLDLIPLENSIVCGYIKDSSSGEPIDNVLVHMMWKDNLGQTYENSTRGDSSGFYKINVCSGKIIIVFAKDDYFTKSEGEFYIYENVTFWLNVTLDPKPPENSIICGYITDASTGVPEMASIRLSWHNSTSGFFYENFTDADVNGFYQINIPPGNFILNVDKGLYFTYTSDEYIINQNEVLWINVSLLPIYNQSVVVCGFVTDFENNQSIENAQIQLTWFDGQQKSYCKHVYTNCEGFYCTNIPPGEIYPLVFPGGQDNYLYYGYSGWLYRHDAKENKTLWINVSLKPKKPEVKIGYPQEGIYKNGLRVLPSQKTVIFGDIPIVVFLESYFGDTEPSWFNITKVEFYIDGKLKATNTIGPGKYFIWLWARGSLIKHRHTIKVIAYDDKGNNATDEIDVWRFF